MPTFYPTMSVAVLTAVMFAEQDKGSREPGKLADLIVLDRDYLTCPLNEVADIEVRQTFVGGKQIFDANSTK